MLNNAKRHIAGVIKSLILDIIHISNTHTELKLNFQMEQNVGTNNERSGDMAQQMINEERNKAIDEFVQIFKSRTRMENKLVDEIAEELKAERSVTTSKAHEHIMRRFMKKE